ncbi:MAG: metallophosphoesterase [Bacteroidota bacterium]
MRSRVNFVHFILALYVICDIYTYAGLLALVPRRYLRGFQLLYVVFSAFVYYCFYRVYVILFSGHFFSSSEGNIFLGIFLTALVGKLVFTALLLFQDLFRLLYGSGRLVRGLWAPKQGAEKMPFLPKRRKLLTLATAGIAAVPFFSMLYGITKGKYRYVLNRVKLTFKDLPPAFEGYKIVQISDIHAGSLDSKAAVERGIQLVNDQSPDLILFTGDMVNSNKDEVDPFIELFGALRAKQGKYSVLGNHDYYGVPRNSESEKAAYWASFEEKFVQMGFQLLNNQSAVVEKGTDRIQIVGVENWGAGRFFPKEGDLDQALDGVTDQDFCILLSHDPSHWDQKVLDHPRHIPLTLSGHTHGFQFGINMPGFKWSPAQYRYPRWMGLYREKEQYLYVNRGFGFLSFPGRVGMWPEITVFELSGKA